jgi:signal transduction histidine kinase
VEAIVNKLPTQFAPAERAPEAEVRRDAEYYKKVSLVDTMLDAVPEMVLVLNAQRQTVFANEACIRLLNLPGRDAARGQRTGELIGCVHATETEGGCGTTEFCRNCGAVKAILGSLSGIETVQECRITLENGDSLDLRASAKPLELNGRLFSIFTLQDISDEKRRRALERIFFHDVLNTAGILSMIAEIMGHDPSDAASMIVELSESTHRLINEIRSQQDLIAAESGELQPQSQSFSVSHFLTDLVTQYGHHSVAVDRHIQVLAVDEDLILASDVTLLGRVIGNMIKNALEASKPGETVTVSCTATDDLVTIAVHNPTFIPRNVQLQIFNRSFSTKGAGRGLGTYSMKLLSERYLNGHVWFESSSETGTTFYASYPH